MGKVVVVAAAAVDGLVQIRLRATSSRWDQLDPVVVEVWERSMQEGSDQRSRFSERYN